MAQDHQKDTKPSEDNKVGAAPPSAGHAYERFVGWLAIGVLWIAQAEPLRWWREKGRK